MSGWRDGTIVTGDIVYHNHGKYKTLTISNYDTQVNFIRDKIGKTFLYRVVVRKGKYNTKKKTFEYEIDSGKRFDYTTEAAAMKKFFNVAFKDMS